MKTKLNLFILLSFLSISVFAQDLEDDPEFGALKAEFLMQKGRFEDAIKVLNDVLKKDPENQTYILIRAEAKYALGAYKGAKKDAMSYIETSGINEKLCYVMGRTELAMGNPKAAIGYLEALIGWNDSEADYYLQRGNAYWELEEEELACADWHKALRMGSDYAAHKARTYCPRIRIPIETKPAEDNSDDEVEDTDRTNPDKQIPPYDQGDNQEDTSDYPSDNTSDDQSNDDPVVDDTQEEEIPEEPIDNTINRIYIDEDLTIEIRDGIGSREVRELPDMLILSDKSGVVAVDICVDKYGEVREAVVNRDKSTIYTISLVNLALRKSKEIYFERTWKKEQCGSIYFNIKGSN
jgi:tetratricopeptide (TPR) repeat protein